MVRASVSKAIPRVLELYTHNIAIFPRKILKLTSIKSTNGIIKFYRDLLNVKINLQLLVTYWHHTSLFITYFHLFQKVGARSDSIQNHNETGLSNISWTSKMPRAVQIGYELPKTKSSLSVRDVQYNVNGYIPSEKN